MATKLRIEDLAVQSFATGRGPVVRVAGVTAADNTCSTCHPNECGNTMDEFCYSGNPLCSLDCINPSAQTDNALCCG
jgi:hypothetical protein